MTESAVINIGIKGKSYADTDLGKREDAWEVALGLTLGDGSTAGNFNKVFRDTRTLAASATESLDLAGGLTDAFGNTITFTAIKAIIIKAASGNTNDVIIGNAASNQFVGPFGAAAHTVQLKPGQIFAISATNTGWTVTASTGDLLKIANSAGSTSVNYDILILGIG